MPSGTPVTKTTAPVIQRVRHKYVSGSWTVIDPSGDDRYGHPSLIGGGYKPSNGDTFDTATGELVKVPKTGGKIVKAATSEHVLDYAGGSRKSYGGWYGDQRHKTAYSYTSGAVGGSEQGPHTIAHIGKRAMAEASDRSRKGYDPRDIRAGSALLPTAAKNRALIRHHEENTGIAIEPERKKALNKAFKADHEVLEASRGEAKGVKAKQGRDAAVRLMELNALGTYALGRPATDPELANKGENRGGAVEDLKELAALATGEDLPADLSILDPRTAGHSPKHIAQLGRAVGKVAAGMTTELSDLDVTEDEDYSSD